MSADTPALSPFHLAFPVHDLKAAREFYGEVLGCTEGRSSDHWIDFDFFGHQIVAHLSDLAEAAGPIANDVDGHDVPVPHFGVVLSMDEWQAMADRLTAMNVEFVIEPYLRFEGQPGEQGTLFFKDPSGNAIEMKGFADRSRLFAR
jgi:extradiol dioxygenase family protein